MFYASWVYSEAMVLSFVVLNSSLISSIVLNFFKFVFILKKIMFISFIFNLIVL